MTEAFPHGALSASSRFFRVFLCTLSAAFFFPAAPAAARSFSAVSDALPEIASLSHRDPLFRQYSADVQDARIALAAEKPAQELAAKLALYVYRAQADDDLLSLAARCAVPYESIATLNGLGHAGEDIAGRTLLLPSVPGLYVPETPENAFEELLAASLSEEIREIRSAGGAERRGGIRLSIGETRFFLFPGAGMENTARTFFLVRTMRFPLPEGRLTSAYGDRINPVTGNRVFHRGIDLAAPQGTPVYACAAGTVAESGYSPVYGNYIILRHDGGRESLYGHLHEKKIKLHDLVKSGTIIGSVGSTGQSTGPHLHFEIHENGIPRNPAGLLR